MASSAPKESCPRLKLNFKDSGPVLADLFLEGQFGDCEWVFLWQSCRGGLSNCYQPGDFSWQSKWARIIHLLSHKLSPKPGIRRLDNLWQSNWLHFLIRRFRWSTICHRLVKNFSWKLHDCEITWNWLMLRDTDCHRKGKNASWANQDAVIAA